ncbi:dihydroneopterin aldolase [Alkalibacter saccharofermentans]|uniref:7,8-dihydroneopterin aldolase n=1 Tax=Alkalibacter saccharofermentans DSM 14828 TaxID=1120975 RepID=A0A1M4TQ65_9FIRM|nr:dihydroneopterin aldolase [Alkalibacter saccharofermentans]SHE46593.1 dihydroneopterin aldolase [Alkalibacter saccharofermentans DSM 14828]
MDKIIMKNMAFFARHGVMDEEKRLGQRFYVDVTLYLDLKEAGITDDLTKTAHYGRIYNKIKDQIENKRYDLIEALAENICLEVLQNFNLIQKMKVQVKKPEAPVEGIFDYMAVEVTRER